MSEQKSMVIGSSPQFHHEDSTAKIMWIVSATLLPAAIWGVFVFGFRSLFPLLVAISAAVFAEGIINFVKKELTLFDGSAVLTGLLIGMNMPPSVPWFVPASASIFAILVVKWAFGGLGRNWMNPALAGRAFVFFSWSKHMSIWNAPNTWMANDFVSSASHIDAVTSASPLGFVQGGLMEGVSGAAGPMSYLAQNGYPHSALDGSVTTALNANIFSHLGINMPAGYFDLFLGNIPGCIGEVSALLLLLGSVVLIAKKIITWDIPASYLGSFAFLVFVFGGLQFDRGFFSGDMIFHLFTGGLILGAFYMATDMVTSPLTKKGRIIYGIGCGFITFLIRFYGSIPEGVSLAIIFMNIFVPMIDRFTKLKKFGAIEEEAAE